MINNLMKKRKSLRPTSHKKLLEAIEKLGGRCVRCGFVPEHPVQIQFDHIDGDPLNCEPSNAQLLCCNCHTLKTFCNREYLHEDGRPATAETTLIDDMRPFPPFPMRALNPLRIKRIDAVGQ